MISAAYSFTNQSLLSLASRFNFSSSSSTPSSRDQRIASAIKKPLKFIKRIFSGAVALGSLAVYMIFPLGAKDHYHLVSMIYEYTLRFFKGHFFKGS